MAETILRPLIPSRHSSPLDRIRIHLARARLMIDAVQDRRHVFAAPARAALNCVIGELEAAAAALSEARAPNVEQVLAHDEWLRRVAGDD